MEGQSKRLEDDMMTSQNSESLRPYDIAIIGNYCKDTIVSAAGTRYADGGGFNYGAHVAAMMGLTVAAITRLAKSDFHVVDALKELGVEVFAVATAESTCMRLEYPTDNLDERILTVASTAGAFVPAQVENVHARAFLINTSTSDEVNLEVIAQLREKDGMLAADLQGFMRTPNDGGKLVCGEWPERQEVLSRIDVLKTDAVEARMLTGEKEIKAAARKLAEMGPKEVVVTRRDGVLVFSDGNFYEASFFPRMLLGRTGRGDTCIASYLAKRLTASPRDATIWAAAVTSLKMEAEGPIRREIGEIEDLIQTRYRV
jgi:sugar/nucleoside kinase (ribokinase family)